MNRRLLIVLLCAAGSAQAGGEAFNGRWVIRPLGDNGGRVLWLEISGAGTGSVTGSMVGAGPGGQLDTVRDARIEGGQLHFHLERTFGRERRVQARTDVVAALVDGKLHGVALRRRGSLLWVGERAPEIPDRDDGSWKEGEPVALFDGSGLGGWHGHNAGWFVEEGVLKNSKGAGVLMSDASFWNFRLAVEYRVHPRMNGGIGLRGRYEIQILDDHGRPASDHGNGALYGRIAPSANVSRPAGEWQTLDVRLVGRELTVTLNGVRTIERAVIEGFTAMATDWREGDPGPVTLQGDHGAVEFRKIEITPLVQ